MPYITHPPAKKLSEVCHQIWEILSARIKSPISWWLIHTTDKYRSIYRYWIKLYKSRGKTPIQKRWSISGPHPPMQWKTGNIPDVPEGTTQLGESPVLRNFPPTAKRRLWPIPSAFISNTAAWFWFPFQVTVFSTFPSYLKTVLMFTFS